MTLTTINIEEVKACTDAALGALQQELRDLNHQVYSSSWSEFLSARLTSLVVIIRSGQTPSLPTRSTAPTIQSVTSSKDKVLPLLATPMGLIYLLRL